MGSGTGRASGPGRASDARIESVTGRPHNHESSTLSGVRALDPMTTPQSQSHSQGVAPDIALDSSYARLPEGFFARVEPAALTRPELLRLNRSLAAQLGMDPDALEKPQGVEFLSGQRTATGSEPLAMAYAGHQFGQFVPSLGDGRAVLLGEVVDRLGVRRDIHLKGSGRTPFSRMGDGRAALGPVLREYVISEAMAALGIPTTRALAMLSTGETVYRERPEPGAILVRVAAGHVRVGTFEYFYRRNDLESVRVLADYVIERHYPHCNEADNPYRALFGEVVARQADLIAQWMLVGFIHGVMNTDNMSITGETIDYGPCAFMDAYAAETVYSSIDHGGRYAYNQQPRIGFWNLAQLAQCLLHLLDDDESRATEAAQEMLDGFAARFEDKFHEGLRAKIGLADAHDNDIELALDLLHRMSEQRADFTNTFRGLSELSAGDTAQNVAQDAADNSAVRALFDDPNVFDEWAARWRQRLKGESRGDEARRTAMRAVNPAYIPRNHRVQQAIDAASQANDLQPLEDLLTVIGRPFEDHPQLFDYARPPLPEEVVARTFCGT